MTGMEQKVCYELLCVDVIIIKQWYALKKIYSTVESVMINDWVTMKTRNTQ